MAFPQVDLRVGSASSSGVLLWHLAGIERVSGTPYGDVITGGAGADVVWSRPRLRTGLRPRSGPGIIR
jgi:hypothetical protein